MMFKKFKHYTKRKIAMYNKAFGYIKAYLVFNGFFGGFLALLGAILFPYALLGKDKVGYGRVGFLAIAVLLELSAYLFFAIAKKKCSPDTDTKTLFKDMIIVGLYPCLILTFIYAWFIFLCLKLIFKWDCFSSSSSGSQGFAERYIRHDDNEYFRLMSGYGYGNYAILVDDAGHEVEVYTNDIDVSDDILRDGNGRLYYPVK